MGALIESWYDHLDRCRQCERTLHMCSMGQALFLAAEEEAEAEVAKMFNQEPIEHEEPN